VRTDGHTALEQKVMQSHRWLTAEELAALEEKYFPEDLIELWQREAHAAR
jgi:hypothetical protein